jgi:type IV pilus assembly protein PilV
MSTMSRNAMRSTGFTLLEVLVALLILSVGVVGLVGLQAVSAKNSTDARYRSEAATLTSRLIATMWVSDRTVATLQTNFNTGGSAYTTWLSQVTSTLPGVVADTPTAPVVAIDSDGLVTVTVYWIAPNEGPSAVPHNLTTVAQVR